MPAIRFRPSSILVAVGPALEAKMHGERAYEAAIERAVGTAWTPDDAPALPMVVGGSAAIHSAVVPRMLPRRLRLALSERRGWAHEALVVLNGGQDGATAAGAASVDDEVDDEMDVDEWAWRRHMARLGLKLDSDAAQAALPANVIKRQHEQAYGPVPHPYYADHPPARESYPERLLAAGERRKYAMAEDAEKRDVKARSKYEARMAAKAAAKAAVAHGGEAPMAVAAAAVEGGEAPTAVEEAE